MEPDLLRVPVGPGAVHVERYGHGGTAVVLVHGFGTCSFLWRAIAPEIAAGRHTAVAIDLLGYGQSDRPLDTEYGIAAQADYLDRAMTALRLPRAAVVGIDLGGAVALRLAALRKERVSHLALINSLAPDSVPSADLRALTRNTARFALRVAGSGLLGVASLLTPLLEESVSDPAHMPPRLVARYLAPYVGQDGVNHLLALARAVRAEDLSDIDPASIRVPTLVVRGDDDIWLDGDVAGRLAASLPNGQLARISGVGRLIPEEAPDQLTSLLLDFVEGRLEGRSEAETRSLS